MRFVVFRLSFAAVAFLGMTSCLSGSSKTKLSRSMPVSSGGSPASASVTLHGGSSRESFSYPLTRKEAVTERIFGVPVSDPYRWLEDGSSKEVLAWESTQDAWARAWLHNLPERDALLKRFRELFYFDQKTPPYHYGHRYFYWTKTSTQEKWVLSWKEGKTGAERILLDPNTWTKDSNLSLAAWSPSKDGKKMVYKVSKNNADDGTLSVIDVETAKRSDIDTIEGAKYADAYWTPQGDGFYYVWAPPNGSVAASEQPGYAEMRFHKLGDSPRHDRIVHEKTGDPQRFTSIYLSLDGHWLFYYVSRGDSANDVYFQDLHSPKKDHPWIPLIVGKEATYSVLEWRDRFYVLTSEGAPHSRVFKVDPNKPDRGQWHEVVSERQDSTLADWAVFGDYMTLSYLKDVTSHLEVHDLNGKFLRAIPLPTLGSASALVGDYYEKDKAYFGFGSFTYPDTVFEVSTKDWNPKIWYQPKVPVDPSQYMSEQVFYRSKDGTRIPMFLLYRKGFQKSGNAPTLLDGYGGFNISSLPSFMYWVYPWLDRGGVYAIPNLRGGGEYGEDWHRAGNRHNKQNVFNDLTAAAEHLVREGYTQSQQLALYGGSNGGLLVGAVITQRPELFRVVLCDIPLLDMIRFPLFGDGKLWVDEYGSPTDPSDFPFLYAYSPYHHVHAGTKYPATLMLSADSDDRVDPMHARKFTAALQSASTGGPVLLRIEKNAGHSGADSTQAAVEKMADEYAFVLSYVQSVPLSIVSSRP